MSISLFSGKMQPYGLLSGNAIVEMTIDGTVYKSVKEYIYKNLFTSETAKAVMAERINNTPYSSAIKIKTDLNAQLYIDALILGTRARYAQDPTFKTAIKNMGDSPISVTWGTDDENRRLHMLFNQLRVNPEEVFFDEKYGEVPFEIVNSVVVGVANALMANSQLPAAPFSELMQYSVKNAQPKRDLVRALDTLDEIVPVLKIKLKDVIYAEEINRFKTHLLDVTLDHILHTVYNNLDPSQYRLAKRQQIAKEQNLISRYETDLYNLYTAGELDAQIIERLEFEPSIPSSSTVTVDAIDEQEEMESIKDPQPFDVRQLETQMVQFYDEKTALPLTIPVPATLLPSAPTRIRIKGVEYTSVVAYAYSVLFANIGITVSTLSTDPLEKIKRDYDLAEQDIMVNRLTDLNEKGTRAKFESKSSIVQLLLATNGNRLVYADADDPILGIGNPLALNRAGTFLEFLRQEYGARINPSSISTPFNTVYDNIVVKKWFASRAADYANTLSMFGVRTAPDLTFIYDIQPENVDVDNISAESIKLMNNAGLSDADQRLVLPFMAADFMQIKFGGIQALCAYYVQQQPTPQDRELAEHTLGYMFHNVQRNLWPHINQLVFVARILSNRPEYDIRQEQWWRIHKWAHIGRIRRVVKH